ncbi:hypothetical protein Rhal01_03229 [Rubritalea halochordaticola]|uniref:Ice-binding protein C-terminal domain-containing protein n=1 Tax=Rubritalea halochordaticola TaxID=714537 RepID=A0ABP9V310_9BACT
MKLKVTLLTSLIAAATASSLCAATTIVDFSSDISAVSTFGNWSSSRITNDGDNGDGLNDGAANFGIPASTGTGNGAIISSTLVITSGMIGQEASATVLHYRTGPNNFANVRLQLTLDGSTVGTETGNLSFSSGTATAPGVTSDSTTTYIVQAGDVGKTLGVQLQSSGTSGGGANFGVDSVTFTAIPEPSSTALVGLAGLGFILRRRR